MPTTDFLPNLLCFAAGQVVAVYYLRTGRYWVGVALSALLWVFGDWALVARFAFAEDGARVAVPLAAMQVLALVASLRLGWRLWRRRRSAGAREGLFAGAIAAYLRNDEARCRGDLRRLVANDPWDAAAWVAWGNLELRAGNAARARRCYRRGLGVDRTKAFADLVAHQFGRAGVPRAPRPHHATDEKLAGAPAAG